MKTIPISEARANLPKLVDDVDKQFSRITLTKSGRPRAVLMSSEEFEQWSETLEILSNTKTMKALQEAQENTARNELVTHEAVLKEINNT